MSEDVQLKSSVGVIGAGIQGVCIGLQLLKKNWTLIDYANQSHWKEFLSLCYLVL